MYLSYDGSEEGAFSWSSKKQMCVSRQMMKANMFTYRFPTIQAVWMKRFVRSLNIGLSKVTWMCFWINYNITDEEQNLISSSENIYIRYSYMDNMVERWEVEAKMRTI